MKIAELFKGRYYSKGRGSRRYLVLDTKMWHKRYVGMDRGYVFGRGRAPEGRSADSMGVPCLVFERDKDEDGNLVPYGSYTSDKPCLIHPKEFLDEYAWQEAAYEDIDAQAKARQQAREKEREAARKDAEAIGVILTNLGVDGFRVHAGTYGSDIAIPEKALASFLRGLQAPAKVYDVTKDEEVQKVLAAKDAEVATTLANNKQIILDLLYELDVTWEEYFSGQEVEVGA